MGSDPFNDQMIADLIGVARSAIASELGATISSSAPSVHVDCENSGVFVTLRHGSALRGCMGTFQPAGTLVATVDRVARLACKDPRFAAQPVTLVELDEIKIEISVLGPLRPVDDPTSLRIGVDGIVVRRGKASGCFLPHVASEAGWTAEEFLDKCCTMKAGLNKGAWREAGTEVLLFTAEVLRE